MKHSAKIFFLLTLISLSFPLAKINAASASLFLSPTSGAHFVGDKFNVLIYVSSASQATNTYDVYLSVSNLTVNGISVGGSICILYPSPPSYNNVSAHFRCGLPTPGYTGSGGYIGSISVKGNTPGTAKVFVDGTSQVLANDGAGTNILTSRGTATFNIQPQPTGSPNVSSSTHPNQESWYKARSATLNWSGSGSNFSYTLDQNSNTNPDQISEGSQTTNTFNELSDGIWYFHVIVKGSNGTWSSPTHFRLQVDSTPPEPFTPEVSPKENGTKRPIIGFNATDKTSGIDHYELKLDDGKFATIPQPYQLPKITSGKHTVYVKAVDKAGNERVSSVDFSIKQVSPPVITRPNEGTIFPYGSNLIIKGVSQIGYEVKIFLDGKEIGRVKTDKNGSFQLTYKELLTAGKHKIYGVAINPDQIESQNSKVVNFQLDPKAYIILGKTIPSSSIWISFIILLITIIGIFVFFWLGAKRFRAKLKTVLEKLEEEVEEDLSKGKVKEETKKEIEEEFEEAEKEVGEK